MIKDELGDRIKTQFENVYRAYLPRKQYYVIRIDQKAGHTYCRNLEKPFDANYAKAMDAVALALCNEVQGAIIGYTHSDECTVILSDINSEKTDLWFGGNIQKISSVSASIATAAFNKTRYIQSIKNIADDPNNDFLVDFSQLPNAYFDSRVFAMPRIEDVMDVLLWRNLDCTRNAVSMAAHSMFSPKQLHKKTSKEMQEMMFTEKGVNFNNYPDIFKSGRVCVKEYRVAPITFTHKQTGEISTVEVERGEWVIKPSPVFTRPEGKEWLEKQLTREK